MELSNKKRAFECGFLPLNKSSSRVSLQFMRVLLLFIVFDLEILLLLSLVLGPHLVILGFLFFLLLGLLVESFLLTLK